MIWQFADDMTVSAMLKCSGDTDILPLWKLKNLEIGQMKIEWLAKMKSFQNVGNCYE